MQVPPARAGIRRSKPELRNRKARRLLILLLACFVHQGDFDLVFAGGKTRRRWRKGKRRSTAARQLDRILGPFFAFSEKLLTWNCP